MTLVEEFRNAVKLIADNAKLAEKRDRKILSACVDRMDKVLKSMPGGYSSEHEALSIFFPEFAAKRNKIIESFDETDWGLSRAINKLEEEYREKLKNEMTTEGIPQTVAEQQVIIAKTISDLEKELSNPKVVSQVYFSCMMGRYGPLLLLMQPPLNSRLKLSAKELEEFTTHSKKTITAFDKETVRLNRSAVKTVLSQLNETQRKKFEQRIGMRIERFSEFYDECDPQDVVKMLRAEFTNTDLGKTPQKSAKLREELKKLFDDSKIAPYKKQRLKSLRMKFHMDVDKQLDLQPYYDLKRHFRMAAQRPRLNLVNNPTWPDAFPQILRKSGYEALPKQVAQLKKVHDAYKSDARTANNLDELIAINNRYQAQNSIILLPEQRAIMFQYFLSAGLVLFLERSDTASDFGFSEQQQRKISQTARKQADKLEKDFEELKIKTYKQTLSGLNESTQKKLAELLNLDLQKAMEVIGKKKSCQRIRGEHDSNSYKGWFKASNQTNSGPG
jgi:hypothetical protein